MRPLKPPPGFGWKEEQVFEDRAALDQGLYDLLAKWARDDIATEKPELVERALGWLGRADKLAGISGAQRDDLRALRAESGYFEARQLLEKTAESLRQARERLRLTAGSSSRHAGDAGEALRRIDPVVDELYQAARALGGSSTPIRAHGPGPGPGPGTHRHPRHRHRHRARPRHPGVDGAGRRRSGVRRAREGAGHTLTHAGTRNTVRRRTREPSC